MYQTIYQKGKEFIGKVFFLLREKLHPSLNLRYINIRLKNISFLLKWKDWKWNCLGNERKYWPICLTYFKGPYSIDFLSRRREYWMFPFCINSMFDILLQKRNVRRRAKNISMKERDKMSHYVVMNDKNVKINFSLIFNWSSWSKKWLFARFVIFYDLIFVIFGRIVFSYTMKLSNNDIEKTKVMQICQIFYYNWNISFAKYLLDLFLHCTHFFCF